MDKCKNRYIPCSHWNDAIHEICLRKFMDTYKKSAYSFESPLFIAFFKISLISSLVDIESLLYYF